MADTTYNNLAVYNKQDGDELVVADGGLITVESGGQIDIETGGEISIESGGTIDVESGGGIDVESTGNITIENGGTFTFYGVAFTVEQINTLLKDQRVYTFGNLSTGATVFSDAGDSSPPVIPSEYGVIIFDPTDGLAAGSARLASANYVGQKVTIKLLGGATGSYCSTAAMQIDLSGNAGGIAGAAVVGPTGSELSSILLAFSSNSAGRVDLQCIADGVWAVTDDDGCTLTVFQGS